MRTNDDPDLRNNPEQNIDQQPKIQVHSEPSKIFIVAKTLMTGFVSYTAIAPVKDGFARVHAT